MSRPAQPSGQNAGPQLVRAAKSGYRHPFDEQFGTDTSGLIPGAELQTGHPSDRFVTAYYAVAPSILQSLLTLWQTQCRPPLPLDRYTFVDIGAGKARSSLLAAANPFQAVWAVERHPGLAQTARQNVAIFSGDQLAPVMVLEADALLLPLPETPTVLFLFHPFEAPAVRRLLRRVEAAFRTRPGQLDLLYVNAEHSAVLDQAETFTQLWRGRIPMSTADHIADLKEIEMQTNYGSTGDEICAVYRFTGRQSATSHRPKSP